MNWIKQAIQVTKGQVKVADHSNEILAIPRLLDVLDISGCIVTTDAMGCQRRIAQIPYSLTAKTLTNL